MAGGRGSRLGSSFEIGPARLEDAPRIARTSRWLIEHGFAWRWTPAKVAWSIRDRDTEVVVARHAGRAIGFAVMHFADDAAHLLLFGVDPRFQRQGLGSRLLDWVEAMARIAGLGSVALEVRASNQGARLFYRTRGYVELAVHGRYYSGVEDAVLMVNHLAAPRCETR